MINQECGVYLSRKDAQVIVDFFAHDNPAHLTVKAMQVAQKIKETLSMVADEKTKVNLPEDSHK
jgi:hypothetical protein